MGKVLLTIAIPTNNRANYLKENLLALLDQCLKYKDFVEIVCSDNCSTDDTEFIFNEFQQKSGLSCHYNRNETNIGLFANFEIVHTLAHGEYMFMMGDDDIMSPNFLDSVMPYLMSDEDYGIIHWGRLGGNKYCSNNRLHEPVFHGMISISSPEDFVKQTLSAPNFISSLLYKKKLWDLGSKHKDHMQSGYGQFARVLWGAIYYQHPCVHYYMPLVIQRNPERVWAKDGPIYLLWEMSEIFSNLESSIPGIYSLWMKRLHDKTYYDIKGTILSISAYPSYYQQYSEKITSHLSRSETLLYKTAINYPRIARLIGRFYHRLQRFGS